MEELKLLKMAMAESNFIGRTIIEEMIKETEISFKKPGNRISKRDLIISLHNSVNELVISEPVNQAFKLAKSRLDDLVLTLR
ncbi:MAG TPA: hypothetical protein VGB37_12505 [Candidatus Lokiarchaeia archaeon]